MRTFLGQKSRHFLKTEKAWLLLMLAFAVLPSVASSSLLLLFYDEIARMAGNTVLTGGFYLVSAFTMCFGLTPTTFIAVISGYFFGWTGLGLMMLAYPAAALMGLGFGRLINRLATGRGNFEDEKLRFFAERLAEKQFLLYFFCRLSPFLPFAMTNVALSRLNVRLIPYISGTMAGMFPRTLLFFLAGTQTRDIISFLKQPSYDRSETILLPLFILLSASGLYFVFRGATLRLSREWTKEPPEREPDAPQK
jgi:uncharacterized membrane protein YdjX (TVP38/TMEM64 family)